MAYETFAFIYDEVMDDGLYEQWLAFSKRHLPETTKNILELACGTGALAVAFAKDGYNVTGLDLSEEMLMIASQRAYEEEATVQFVEAEYVRSIREWAIPSHHLFLRFFVLYAKRSRSTTSIR